MPTKMSIEKSLFVLAGSMIMLSAALTAFHSIYWLYFTAFIGLNLFQSAFTGFCIPSIIMKKLGMKTEAQLCQLKQ